MTINGTLISNNIFLVEFSLNEKKDIYATRKDKKKKKFYWRP